MLSVQAADIRARLVSSIITENACFVVTDGHASGLASLSCGACEGSEGEGSACLRPASVLVYGAPRDLAGSVSDQPFPL